MLAASLRVVGSALLSFGRSLGVFFVLNKLDISDLRPWRRWNQEEESEQETSEKNTYMEYVGAACGFWHFQEVVMVKRFAL